VQKIVECVPNFSEGKRPEVVREIREAIELVRGIQMLDVESDAAHNRSVFTFVWEPEAALEGAFQGITRAARLIDMNAHKGSHPRIGATDVVPLVPVRGVSMPDCVALARRLGERVSRELAIPVYLYEEAATRPDRVNLENIRRGEYEELKTAITTDAERKPDFGPLVLGSAGATIIGARAPLIAFNVYLNTNDVEIARAIATAIRHSSGGLAHVKALGILAEGRAQVSINLTNYGRTPMARVMEMIRREAARYGAVVTRSELVGLLPAEALTDVAAYYLQLDRFSPSQVLENRLAELEKAP
jgi:glutamate formiminotransferase